MTGRREAVRLKGEADEPGWEVDPDDEWGLAIVATVGRQLKLRREAVGMRAGKFGEAVGYGEDMIYKIESGKRIPRPEYPGQGGRGAGGGWAAVSDEGGRGEGPVSEEGAGLGGAGGEGRRAAARTAITTMHGLLQTTEYAWALLGLRRPA